VTDERHGRYFAQELSFDQDNGARERLQDALYNGESRKWHLVGASGAPTEGGMILYWDTARPSFGRRYD